MSGRSRRLVPVARLGLPGEPEVTHLSVAARHEYLQEWIHGLAICGYSTTQGPLPDGTAVTCPDCLSKRALFEQALSRGDTRMTRAEALEEVDRLGLELYRAQDAVAFVGECCDIADREGRTVTTAQVREWLQGPQCARQARLVLPAEGGA